LGEDPLFVLWPEAERKRRPDVEPHRSSHRRVQEARGRGGLHAPHRRGSARQGGADGAGHQGRIQDGPGRQAWFRAAGRRGLLPEFAKALEPIYADAKAANKGIKDHFVAHSEQVADALLTITDDKAKRSKSGMVKGTYEKLRGSAKKNVEAAVPRLAAMIEKHAS
jgi:hypothetical protein